MKLPVRDLFLHLLKGACLQRSVLRMIFMRGLVSAGRLASDSFLKNVEDISNVVKARSKFVRKE